jgi:hypothetical protein
VGYSVRVDGAGDFFTSQALHSQPLREVESVSYSLQYVAIYSKLTRGYPINMKKIRIKVSPKNI